MEDAGWRRAPLDIQALKAEAIKLGFDPREYLELEIRSAGHNRFHMSYVGFKLSPRHIRFQAYGGAFTREERHQTWAALGHVKKKWEPGWNRL